MKSAVLFSASMLAANAGAQAMQGVELKLSVSDAKDKVLVHLVLTNHGGQGVKVPRTLASDHDLFGPMFAVKDADTGQEIAYQGIMVKRGALGPEDFIALKPKAVRQNTIDITDSYAFKAGPHNYQLSYAGTAGEQVALTAPVATFRHTGK